MLDKFKEWWSQHYKVVAWVLLVLIIIAVITTGFLYITRDTNPIPKDIRTKLSFSPLVIPIDSKNYSVTDYKFTTYEGKIPNLSYKVNTQKTSVFISEQPQPQEFTDIAEYKDRFLDNVAKQYDTVQTSNGTIYLGRLSKQNNKQLGIMLERGLLVFLNPNKDMNQTQWRNLGDVLDVQKK